MMTSPDSISKKITAPVGKEQFEHGTSLFKDSMRKFMKNKMAVFGCITISFLFLVSLLAKFTAPYSFDAGSLETQNFPPTWYKFAMSAEYKTKMLVWAKKTAVSMDDEDAFGANEDEIEADKNGQLIFDTDTEHVRPTPVNLFDQNLTHLEAEGVLPI